MLKVALSKFAFFTLTCFSVFSFLSFTPAKKNAYCTAWLVIKNVSSTRTITSITLTNATSTTTISVNIPPGATQQPPTPNFAGNSTLSVTFSSSVPHGDISLKQTDWDYPDVACSNFTNSNTGTVSWFAYCGHYLVSAVDIASGCPL